MSKVMRKLPGDYAELLAEVKERVRAAQYAAFRAVNKELVGLYWDIGRMIAEKQKTEGWGKSVVQQLAADLQAEFPGVRGFSVQNLCICGSFIWNTMTTQNSNHWLEKSVGPRTW